MERFRPDSWLDGFLRPLLLGDPTTFLYVEMNAPDLRFIALVMVGVAVCLSGGMRRLTSAQLRATAFMVISFYLWTFVSGNGRYFLPGLLIVGPILVALFSQLPGTKVFKTLLLLLASGLHFAVILDFYREAPWSVSRWYRGDAIALSPSPLRKQPALFLKVSANSYSALVPHFHPQSQWVMLGGHLNRATDSHDFVRLEGVLDSKLPKYAVTVKGADVEDERGQPLPEIRVATRAGLRPYGLDTTDDDCLSISTNANPGGLDRDSRLSNAQGFWFCPVVRVAALGTQTNQQSVLPRERQTLFEHFERACPRFFPPGSGWDTQFDGVSRRYYQSTDIRLYAAHDGSVYYQYFRNLKLTKVGQDESILRNEIEIPCSRIEGRYRPPWLSR